MLGLVAVLQLHYGAEERATMMTVRRKSSITILLCNIATFDILSNVYDTWK